MWSFILYILAVVVGLVLIWFFEPKDEKEQEAAKMAMMVNPRRHQEPWQLSSIFVALGFSIDETCSFQAFEEHFDSLEDISHACRRAGLEKSNLIVGVDFTASNEWQGRKSFNQQNLHKIVSQKVYNPYQKVIWILGNTLKPFDEDNLIPAYGFGDKITTDEGVFPLKPNESPCDGFEDVLRSYNETAKSVTLGGPTSYAPIITKAVDIVRNTKKYHILVIIADGQVTEEKITMDAIVEASKYPLSIIVVGVGDGPWDIMMEFDHRLPKRKFDNFRFVDYHQATQKTKNPDTAFALQALMEIPDQYKVIKQLEYLEALQSCSKNQVNGHSTAL